jgi:DNA invertase Pin-like site-specific DNA recombinase
MEPEKEGAGARAAIYTGVSKDFTLDRLAVGRQLMDCLALAKGKGWRVLDEKFEDNDISAAGGKHRPAYHRLMALMEAGDVDVVVVYSAAAFIATHVNWRIGLIWV